MHQTVRLNRFIAMNADNLWTHDGRNVFPGIALSSIYIINRIHTSKRFHVDFYWYNVFIIFKLRDALRRECHTPKYVHYGLRVCKE